DRWDAHTYSCALELNGTLAAFAVRQVGPPDTPRLAITLTGAEVGQETETLARAALTRLLGLTVDLSAFLALASQDPLLDEFVRRLRGLKPPRFPSVFEALVNAIACQQLSLEVGIHLPNRLTVAWGRPVGCGPGRCAHSPRRRISRPPAGRAQAPRLQLRQGTRDRRHRNRGRGRHPRFGGAGPAG
ncbi:MAG: hypothetical protein ACRDPA_20555, partial [Solirubrobacteraceae bacterium]